MIPNKNDQPFLSRMVIAYFDELQESSSAFESKPTLFAEWSACKELASCLTPDLAALLFNGKLDADAISDCNAFLTSVFSQNRSRALAMHAYVLYYMLLLNTLFQAGPESNEDVVKYVLSICSRTFFSSQTRLTANSSLKRFVSHICRLRADIGCEHLANDAVDRTIYLHNMRTTLAPRGETGSWIALRVESCLTVIANVLHENMDPVDIMAGAGRSPSAKRGSAKFYDVTRCQWPPMITDFDDAAGTQFVRAIQEHELRPNQLVEAKCIFIRSEMFKEAVPDIYSDINLPTYEDVVIESANVGSGKYNFVHVVTGQGDGWFGFRALESGHFGAYCGASNGFLHVGSPALGKAKVVADIQMEHEILRDGEAWDTPYLPSRLLDLFTYEFQDVQNMPPSIRSCIFQHEMYDTNTESWCVQDEVNEQTTNTTTPPQEDGLASSSPVLTNVTNAAEKETAGGGAKRRWKKNKKPQIVLSSSSEDEEGEIKDAESLADAGSSSSEEART